MQSNPSNSAAEPTKTACGGTLKNTAGYPNAIYGGERIYFCTQACLHSFEQHPDDFIAGKIQHPLEAESRFSHNSRLRKIPEPADSR